MLLSNKMTVTIWLTLLRFYLIIWLSPSWILPSTAKVFPASETKKLALIPSQLPTWPWYVRMYDRWDDSHFLIYHPCRHLLFRKIIVVPYVDTHAKVTDFLPFRTTFLSILLPLSQNLTPSLCTTSYVHKLRKWQPLSPFLHYRN